MLVNIVKTGQYAAGTAHATAVFSEPPPFAVNGESFDFGLVGGGERHSARTGSQGRQLTPPLLLLNSVKFHCSLVYRAVWRERSGRRPRFIIPNINAA